MAGDSPLILLRDEVYTRIALKKSLDEFSFNTFGLRKTWKPQSSPEEMSTTYADGLLTVIGGLFGDHVALDRENLVVGEYSVKIGFQKYIVTDVGLPDTVPIDVLINFVEELDAVCRHEVAVTLDNGCQLSYVRTEFEKDDTGLPFHFVRIAETATFEAYFDAFFQVPLI